MTTHVRPREKLSRSARFAQSSTLKNIHRVILGNEQVGKACPGNSSFAR